jgi:sulfhydrogenase subunit gamma (sulfur reductase)
MPNVYAPHLAEVKEIVQETPDTRTYRLEFADEKVRKDFTFEPGQFGEYSAFGEGESTFCIASSPTRKGYIECTFKEVGRVTGGLSRRNVGDIVGFRGPYGNHFPYEDFSGKNLHIVGGGIGLAPLRSLIWFVLDNRKDYKKVTILYGARSVADLIYRSELDEWGKRKDVNLVLTVDPGGETPDWKGKIGFVPPVMEEVGLDPKDAYVVTCGPPIMIKFAFQSLGKMGFPPERVITTLENRMKCGIGKCGRCNVGAKYVCIDGPVFSQEEINELPPDF